MSIYVLQAIHESTPWYDCCVQAIVRAETEDDARRLLNDFAPGDEVKRFGDVWLDPQKTTCELLSEYGQDEVICRESFVREA